MSLYSTLFGKPHVFLFDLPTVEYKLNDLYVTGLIETEGMSFNGSL